MSNDAVNQSSRPPAVLPHPFGDAVLERLREVAGRVVAGVPGIERVMAAYFALAEVVAVVLRGQGINSAPIYADLIARELAHHFDIQPK